MHFPNRIAVAIWIFCVTIVTSRQLLPYGEDDVTVTFDTGHVKVNLSFPVPIHGRKKFSCVNINRDGSLSFGDPIRSTNLNSVMGDLILYAPLLMPTAGTTRQVFYREVLGGEEMNEFEEDISSKLSDQDIQLQQLFVATFKFTFSDTEENVYQIVIGSNSKRSYVRFVYESIDVARHNDQYARAGIFGTLDGASICSQEISGSGTPQIADLERSTNAKENGTFLFRTDLPLECTTLVTECGDPNEIPDRFNACPVATFMETGATWSIYTFYFCEAGLTREGGRVSIKRQCRYDPDYYTHEWRELNENERCTQRLANFWSAFFASSTQMTISATTMRTH